jgi:NTP pyrophosphatase (non-canonical NTP hydrolase)
MTASSCQRCIQKWTTHSHVSGVITENQWIDVEQKDSQNKVSINGKVTELVGSIVLFTNARKWEQFDTPHNSMLATVSEAGELAELAQWEGDAGVDESADGAPLHRNGRNRLAQEIADICICVLKLANALNVAGGRLGRRFGRRFIPSSRQTFVFIFFSCHLFHSLCCLSCNLLHLGSPNDINAQMQMGLMDTWFHTK